MPKLLKPERQEYLTKKIKPLVPEEYWNVISEPKQDVENCVESKYPMVIKDNQRYLNLSWKVYVKCEMEEEIRMMRDGELISSDIGFRKGVWGR